MFSYFKVEFLLETPTNNVHVASAVRGMLLELLDKEGTRVRLCFEGNADSWLYVYVAVPADLSVSALRQLLANKMTLFPFDKVRVGTIYDIEEGTVVTPRGRTIKQVFETSVDDVKKLALELWQETLIGEPSVAFIEKEPIIRLGTSTDDKRKLSWRKS